MKFFRCSYPGFIVECGIEEFPQLRNYWHISKMCIGELNVAEILEQQVGNVIVRLKMCEDVQISWVPFREKEP